MTRNGGWARSAAWSAAATLLGILATASGIHRAEQLGVDLLLSGSILGALVGLAVGVAAGWNLGSRGLLYPLLVVPGLYAANLLVGGMFWDAAFHLIVFTMPLFAAAGVFLGGWLAGSKGGVPGIYPQTLGAFVMSFVFVSVLAQHLSTFVPASHRDEIPPWFRRMYLLWSFGFLGAVLWWVRPIRRHLAEAGSELQALARRRGVGIYGFVAAMAGVWAAPSLLYWAVGGARVWVAFHDRRGLLSGLSGDHFSEPYLFSSVLPRFTTGRNSAAASGEDMSVRWKLWLMVASWWSCRCSWWWRPCSSSIDLWPPLAGPVSFVIVACAASSATPRCSTKHYSPLVRAGQEDGARGGGGFRRADHGALGR